MLSVLTDHFTWHVVTNAQAFCNAANRAAITQDKSYNSEANRRLQSNAGSLETCRDKTVAAGTVDLFNVR